MNQWMYGYPIFRQFQVMSLVPWQLRKIAQIHGCSCYRLRYWLGGKRCFFLLYAYHGGGVGLAKNVMWLFQHALMLITLVLLLELPTRPWYCALNLPGTSNTLLMLRRYALDLIFELPTLSWYYALNLLLENPTNSDMLCLNFHDMHEDAMVRSSKLWLRPLRPQINAGIVTVEWGFVELDLPIAMALQQPAQHLANGASGHAPLKRRPSMEHAAGLKHPAGWETEPTFCLFLAFIC